MDAFAVVHSCAVMGADVSTVMLSYEIVRQTGNTSSCLTTRTLRHHHSFHLEE